jgi:hypothetical protein
VIKLTTKRTKKTTKSIQAIFEAVPARPLKPETAAISAITKNVIAQLNIMRPPYKNIQYVDACADSDWRVTALERKNIL